MTSSGSAASARRSGRPDVTSLWKEEDDRFAPQTFKAAMNWLERHYEEKFFLYIDAWDPHEPWDPPAHYVKPYLPDYRGEQVYPAYWDWEDAGYSERDLEIAKATYKGEITMVDRWFGLLIDRLQSLGIYDEHRHPLRLRPRLLLRRIRRLRQEPLPLARQHDSGDGSDGALQARRDLLPQPKAQRNHPRAALSPRSPATTIDAFHGLVSIPDMMPTMLELAGIDIPSRVQAQSLLPLARRGRPAA